MEEEITQEQFAEAKRVVEAYNRAEVERVAAQRAAYAVPVKALVDSPEYQAVFDALDHMVRNYQDDSYYGIPVGSLHTIARNLAEQVGVTMVASPVEQGEGTSDGE